MNNIEKQCKWYFPPLIDGIDEQNTTNSDEETLKNQSSIEALVRESIQNSLDVHDPESGKPVVVEFKFGSINDPQETIPAFLEIEEHIKGAKDYILSKGNSSADLYFDPMLSFMENHRKSFPYLCVSDYNTIGMNYAGKDAPSRFFSFMNNGFNDKNDPGSGGSYGIGKAAYYMFSEIRTILISSMFKDESNMNHLVFKGSSKLTTHMFRGQKLYNKGHYDKDTANPITEKDDIPADFLRKDMGTSIFIMGIDDSINCKENYRREIIKSVLRNFWLAIYEKKLEVIVDFETDPNSSDYIDKARLKELMTLFQEYDNKNEYTSPRPYFEAVTTASVFNPQAPKQPAVYFDNNDPVFGHARFYLIKNNQLHDRFIKMRSPRMFVSMEKVAGKRGFNGVLVCDDSWDRLLKQAEPPAHDNWEKRRINEKNNIDADTKQKASLALNSITKWVMECISSYFNDSHDQDTDFCGIKDLLYTDKDFGSNSQHSGNSISQEEGIPTGEEGEDGIVTSKSLGIDTNNEVKVRPIASVTAVKNSKATPNEKGKLRGKRRKPRKKDPTIIREHTPGTDFPVSTNSKGRQGKYREIFDVAVRCFIPSGQEDEHLYTMVINSARKIDKAMVEIITGAAIGTLDIPISNSDKGSVDKNRICDIPLEVGINTLHFKFNDNISHSITTATYEFK